MPKLKRDTPVQSSNGHAPREGRIKLLSLSDGFTFPYEEVTPDMAAGIMMAQRAQPEPPMKEVEAVEGTRTVADENDPAYQAALSMWRFDAVRDKTLALLKYGSRYAMTDDDNELLDEFLEDMGQLDGNESRKWTRRSRVAAFIVKFHAHNQEDYNAIVTSLSGTPTVQEVETVKATFQRDLQGQAD